jgi:ribose transport system substrate-binding protein
MGTYAEKKYANFRVTAIAAAAVACAVGALATPASAEKVDRFYLGVGTTTSEYWADVTLGAKTMADSVGGNLQVIASDFQGEKLLQQFGAIFSAGCAHCVVVVDPASNAFTKALVQRAADANASIITLWNRPESIHPWDTAPNDWVANTSFDGVDSGYQNGMALCKALNGKGNIVALGGIPDNPPAKQRLAGLAKALKDCPGMKLLDTQVGDWDTTKGQNLVRAWLARYGADLNGVFSANDGMAVGAVAALREKGLNGKIPVTGSDGSSDAIKFVASGDMLSTMKVDAVGQGAIATALAYAAASGDIDVAKLTHAQRDFWLKQTLVTKDNAAAILAAKPDLAEYTYEKIKANFWATSPGQIPVGANK